LGGQHTEDDILLYEFRMHPNVPIKDVCSPALNTPSSSAAAAAAAKISKKHGGVCVVFHA
jgi:hypothetical protein